MTSRAPRGLQPGGVGWGSLSPEARAAPDHHTAWQAAREARTWDELEAEKALKLTYVSEQRDDGFAMIMAWVITLAIALVTGVVLLVVFVVVGRSPWAVVAGTAIGRRLGPFRTQDSWLVDRPCRLARAEGCDDLSERHGLAVSTRDRDAESDPDLVGSWLRWQELEHEGRPFGRC